MLKQHIIKTVVLTLLLTLSILNGSGVLLLFKTGLHSRYVPLEQSESDISIYNALQDAESWSKFDKKLKENDIEIREDNLIEGILRIQRLIGNSISSVGVYSGREHGFELLEVGINGTGLACGSLSDILKEGAMVLGLKARLVQLYASNFSRNDTHVVVEILVNGRWIVFDPTFNATYEYDNNPLGIQEIQQYLKEKGPKSVTAKFHGDTQYPARLDEYYMDWRLLFNNAYAFRPTKSWWEKIPPIRFLFGPHRYYYGDTAGREVSSANLSILVFFFVLPSIIACLSVVYIVLLVTDKRNRRLKKASSN